MTQSDVTLPPGSPRKVSGRYVVLTMLGLGVLCTAGIWTYWKLHLAPFLPLQQALIAEFPGSSPRVDGGKRRSSDPQTLRFVLQVDYPPLETDPRVPESIERIIAIGRRHLDFSQYDELLIHLLYRPPERTPQVYEFKRKMAEVPEGAPSDEAESGR